MPTRARVALIAAIGIGGGLGAAIRWLAQGAPTVSASGNPWGTFTINVIGCLLIGGLSAWLSARSWPGNRADYARALVGVGFLGGFTTFSAYAGETIDLLATGSTTMALAYLLGTVVSCLLAVLVGSESVRRLMGARVNQA
ncbi:MAG: fluoride efflux transporter CrcB [Candidatus Nanopelagicales bacterium]